MAYLGNVPGPIPSSFQQVNAQGFNGDGTTVAFTLSRAVTATKDIEVIVNNVQQNPYDSSYSVSGTTLTFSEAPSSGTNNIYVIYRDIPLTTIDPTDNTVTTSKIVNGAVTTEKIYSDAITTSKVANNTITADKIANNAVTSSKIYDGAVTTSKILDGAVTLDKITGLATVASSGDYDDLSNKPAGFTTGKAIAMSIVFGG